MSLFSWFEKKLDSFPAQEMPIPRPSFSRFVWDASRGLRGFWLGMAVLSAVIAAFEAVLFAVLGRMVDWLAVINPGSLWAEHKGVLLALVGVILASLLVVAVQNLIKYQVLEGNFPMRLRWQYHRLLLGQSMSFFQDEFSGRIATKVMQTAQAVDDFYMIIINIMIYAVIYFVTMVASVGGFDPLFLLPFGLWGLSYVLVLRYIVPKLSQASEALADARSTMVGRITDAYTNISTVKLFSHAGREAAYARESMRGYLQSVYSLLRKISGFEIANHFLSMTLVVSSVGVALWLWSKGQVGVGALAAVGAMALRLNGMSGWIMWETSQLFQQVGSIYDGMDTLAKPRAVVDAPNAGELAVSRGEIRFEDVCFAYRGTEQAVIANFNLDVHPGEKIGLVGRSGAGKTTIVNLLLRFHDVGSGRILIDGQDIAGVTQDSLRAQIGMVMQDTSLLHRSVRDNIKYGRPEATEEQMVDAARRAKADDFIENLRDGHGRAGYAAHVGERGVKLSGGQRQRIAIARVMLKDAPILLLDEATSALDSEVETAIQENLYRLMEGKTVVAIAHRLSTIMAMDRLIVIDGGLIVEQGNHKTLLEKGGVYARLWEHQSGGFLACS